MTIYFQHGIINKTNGVILVTFDEKLNDIMKYLHCSPKELVKYSGLSAATISRYRAGTRLPSEDSTQLCQLISGLAKAAQEAGKDNVTAEMLKNELKVPAAENSKSELSDGLRVNLDLLISTMHISIKDMAAHLGYDYSHLSRIRSGQRNPSDAEQFSRHVGEYVYSCLSEESSRDILSDLLGCTSAELNSLEDVQNKVAGWLCDTSDTPRRYAKEFLVKLDKFDLDTYIERSGAVEAPEAASDEKINDCIFMGAGSYSEAKTAFISAAQQSASTETALVCTDLCSENPLSRDLEWTIALLLQKGLSVKLVLNTDNPIDEVLPGLEALMPVFMTGRLAAFSLKGRRDGVYRNTMISLGDAALWGDAVAGCTDSAVYRVYTSPAEAAFCRRRAEFILEKAEPLMEIIDNDLDKRRRLMSFDEKIPGQRRAVLSTPPIYTINSELLDTILKRNNISDGEAEMIRNYIDSERARVIRILRHSAIEDQIPDIGQEQFRTSPIFLSLSGLFYTRDIFYTYDEYLAHIELARKFSREHPGYTIKPDKTAAFRNTQIFMHEGRWMMLSKNKTPAIHLFITHEKLRRSLENMLTIYADK